MKACESRPVRREIDLSLLDARTQQGERIEQPARARILGEFAEKGLSVDHPLGQRFELSGVQEEESLLVEERRRIGPPNAQEMLPVTGECLGERGGGGLRLLRLSRIDDGDQKILELGKQLFEHLGALTPRQASGEHLVGVGRDAEMTGRVPAGEDHQKYACEDYGER